MLVNLIKSKTFAKLMHDNMTDILVHLFEQEQSFGVLCKIDNVTFEPHLPADITQEFRPMTLFFLAGYTFESAKIIDGALMFEAGFGTDNLGSVVRVPLLSIMQIVIDDTPIFINLASDLSLELESENTNTNDLGVKNSMDSFLSNPENQKFLKK
ncbi:MAG: hypothetical protein GQ570_08745 [Helicobacteraceae bacterium]|nr:hypothetical protein [Helicobacteraceae bacterium]